MSIYADQIIDLYKNPLNQGTLRCASVSYRAYNPLCGDDITIDLLIKSSRIQDIRHRGVGCAISQASASLLTEKVRGEKLQKTMKLKVDDMRAMLGVELGPVRLKCALLGLEAVHQAIQKFLLQHHER